MFMCRGSNGRLEELGKVYVYLQRGPLQLERSECNLLGKEPFGRFGTSVAPLGDLDQDGYNGNLFELKVKILNLCLLRSRLQQPKIRHYQDSRVSLNGLERNCHTLKKTENITDQSCPSRLATSSHTYNKLRAIFSMVCML